MTPPGTTGSWLFHGEAYASDPSQNFAPIPHPSETKLFNSAGRRPHKILKRITLWARDIGSSHSRAATWRAGCRTCLLSGFGATGILAPQLTTSIHQQSTTQLAPPAESSSDGGLHDLVVSSGGAVEGAGPAVPRPPRRLLRRRLRHQEEDQDRQALRCVPCVPTCIS